MGAGGTRGKGPIAALFVVNGLGAPGFLARLPERQADLELSDAALGLTLTGLAVGAIIAGPVAGRLVNLMGSRAIAVAAGVLLGCSLWTAAAAPTPVALFGALALIGAVDASMDIAMNANGARFEQQAGRSLLHRLHAAWSFGALGAAACAGVAAAVGLPLTLHLLLVGGAGTIVVLWARPRLLPDTSAAANPARPSTDLSRWRQLRSWRPRSTALMVLSLAIVGGAVIEGAPVDWSAIQLSRLGAGPGAATIGLAAFMAGMVAGRLAGDIVTDRWGGGSVLRWGMGLAAGGFLAGAISGHPVIFIIGLALAGAGCSGIFPLAFSASARIPGVAPGTGAATVAVASRVGFLLTPVLVGVVAEVTDLRWAFCLLALIAAGTAAAAGRIVPAHPDPAPALVTAEDQPPVAGR